MKSLSKGLVLLVFTSMAFAERSTVDAQGKASDAGRKAVQGSTTKDYNKPGNTSVTPRPSTVINGGTVGGGAHAGQPAAKPLEKNNAVKSSDKDLFGAPAKAAGSDTSPAEAPKARPATDSKTWADAVRGAKESEAAIMTVAKVNETVGTMLLAGQRPEKFRSLSQEEFAKIQEAVKGATEGYADPIKAQLAGVLADKLLEESKTSKEPVNFEQVVKDVQSALGVAKELQAEGQLPEGMTADKLVLNAALVLPVSQLGVIMVGHLGDAAKDAKSSDAKVAKAGKAAISGVLDGIIGKKFEALKKVLASKGASFKDPGKYAHLVDADWRKFAEERLGKEGLKDLCEKCKICPVGG